MYKNKVKVIAFITADGDENHIDKLQEEQQKRLKRFSAEHNLEIVKVVHKGGLGETEAIKKMNRLIEEVGNGVADAILLVNLDQVTKDMSKALTLIKNITLVRGSIVSVENGLLRIALKNFGG